MVCTSAYSFPFLHAAGAGTATQFTKEGSRLHELNEEQLQEFALENQEGS
jgi:hypothetical protein